MRKKRDKEAPRKITKPETQPSRSRERENERSSQVSTSRAPLMVAVTHAYKRRRALVRSEGKHL